MTWIKNSFWFLHHLNRSKARLCYGDPAVFQTTSALSMWPSWLASFYTASDRCGSLPNAQNGLIRSSSLTSTDRNLRAFRYAVWFPVPTKRRWTHGGTSALTSFNSISAYLAFGKRQSRGMSNFPRLTGRLCRYSLPLDQKVSSRGGAKIEQVSRGLRGKIICRVARAAYRVAARYA